MEDGSTNNNGGQTPEEQPNSELLTLRQQALDVLLSSLDGADLPAQQKFEVLITAVRSSSDPALIGRVLEAAKKIDDPKEKVNAVLDVLNEINVQLQASI